MNGNPNNYVPTPLSNSPPINDLRGLLLWGLDRFLVGVTSHAGS